MARTWLQFERRRVPVVSVQQEIIGLMGHRELLRLVQLPKIGFGNLELDPCRAGIFEVAKLGLPIDLILGVNAFRGRRLQFDFIDGRIYIIE
jgi:hypothetical protein